MKGPYEYEVRLDGRKHLRLRSKATALGATCCQNVVASCGSNVVSSCVCEVVKQGLQQMLPTMWLRDMVKTCHEVNAKNVITAFIWDRDFARQENHGVFFFCSGALSLPFEKGRRTVTSTLVFAHDAHRNSATIFYHMW